MVTADLHQPYLGISGEAFDRPQSAAYGGFEEGLRDPFEDGGGLAFGP